LGASTITGVKKIVFVTLSRTHRALTMSAYVASINTSIAKLRDLDRSDFM
jgi:hypothetical protein